MSTVKVTIAAVNFLTLPVKLQSLFYEIRLTITSGIRKWGATENVTAV